MGDGVVRPRLLDLFCGAGGAGMGYHRAGWDVTGVDNRPQPSYPFPYETDDVFNFLDRCDVTRAFDAIHASPVCIGYANVTAWRGDPAAHPRQLAPIIDRLSALGLPAVVENVPEALLTWDELLCGSHFGLAAPDGRTIKRHRGFRYLNWSGFALLSPCDHRNVLPFMHKGERVYADAMGCTWMNKTEARQAIPPAYTEHIGGQLLEHLTGERAA
jgi:DNA (cytosine-5)-methyltransferase 1